MVQLGNIISANIYRADDAPLYHRGNTSLMIINFLILGVFLGTKLYYVSRNKWKARKWDAMTDEVGSFREYAIYCTFTDVECCRRRRTIYKTQRTRGTRGWILDSFIRDIYHTAWRSREESLIMLLRSEELDIDKGVKLDRVMIVHR